MRLLVLAPFLFGPCSAHGGGVLAWRELQALRRDHELTLLAFDNTEARSAEQLHREALAELGVCVRTVPFCVGTYQLLRAKLGSLAGHIPSIVTVMQSARMVAAIQSCLKDGVDLLWVQFPQMAAYVGHAGPVPAVMDVHDAYSISAHRHALVARGAWARWRAEREWLACVRHERTWYPKYRATLTLSEQDAVTLSALQPATHARCIGLPMVDRISPALVPEPRRVGFAGSFGHTPNVVGLHWFLDEVWPLVRRELPDARFVVAGRQPPAELLARSQQGVDFAGFVDDIGAFYAANAVTVVPLLSGGGVKIKTVEAMAAGSAVVSTSIGAEGSGAAEGCHLLVADDAAAFARAVCGLLREPARREAVADAARRHAAVQFSVDAWLGRVRACLEFLAPVA
jgi:polysaccharide biosynthesis protein PslH